MPLASGHAAPPYGIGRCLETPRSGFVQPAGEAGGASGQLVTAELRWRPIESIVFSVFHDWGRVKVNADNNFPGAPALNRFSLRGAGFSFGWQPRPGGINFVGTLAHRIGQNPNATAAGRDQDGSLVRRRVWLSAGLPF